MSTGRFPDGGRLATPSQRLLLQASLLEGQPAIDAWREWDRREDLQKLDDASDRLVGLLWRNLDAHGIEHPTMPKLKGVYRYTWFANREVLRQAGTPIRAFREAGIPTLALKGATLCPLYYRDYGVRRMLDFDLLVPPDRAAEAMAVLRELGAVPQVANAEASIGLRHSEPFVHPAGWAMDLHWYTLWRSASDETFWEHAVPLEVGGEETLAPGATHQLLLVCAHGADWAENAPLRWVADATAVIRTGQVDWDMFVQEANERLLTVVLSATLDYLNGIVEGLVPEDVLRRLHEAPSPRFERAGFRQTAKPISPKRTLYLIWERHRRLKRLKPPGPKPPGLLRFYYDYLSVNWELERPSQFPRAALRRLAASRSGA